MNLAASVAVTLLFLALACATPPTAKVEAQSAARVASSAQSAVRRGPLHFHVSLPLAAAPPDGGTLDLSFDEGGEEAEADGTGEADAGASGGGEVAPPGAGFPWGKVGIALALLAGLALLAVKFLRKVKVLP